MRLRQSTARRACDTMYRLFAALPVPPHIAELLVPLQKGVTGASWRPPENFHVTLRFFGEVDRHLAEELDESLAEIKGRQMKLALAGGGWFGRREPTTLWAGLDPNEALASLAAACERAARRLGFPREPRRFRPHVTLAYCHGTTLAAAEAFTSGLSDFRTPEFWVDRFHLYSSHFGSGPSRYVPEADYPLA